MSWPIIVVAVGGSVLAVRYFYRRYPTLFKFGSTNFSNKLSSNDPSINMGSRLSKANLSGFGYKMTFTEACNILNIPSTSTKEKIRESHKQLMMRNHPDNGGSTYLASKVNEAKDFLIK
ncbi:chaperone, putative [Theileria annulata]|uniref:Chaperone, putative n=1 Tax=Theileria annulata TaxID=5874 RepID=Q4UE58_THEAN|nr:chaperone, putative [Theileria annulata]CAI74631.1 chaperone, putative [Theileria annulata]|eukprot:XP_952363.1 chaperone, putative [Theileria annulata]